MMYTSSISEKVDEVYCVFSMKWGLCWIGWGQKLNLVGILYCRPTKLNIIYTSWMNIWFDQIEHSFCEFCAKEHVITILNSDCVLDTLCLIPGWDKFLSLPPLCSYLLYGSYLPTGCQMLFCKECVCVWGVRGLLTFWCSGWNEWSSDSLIPCLFMSWFLMKSSISLIFLYATNAEWSYDYFVKTLLCIYKCN